MVCTLICLSVLCTLQAFWRGVLVGTGLRWGWGGGRGGLLDADALAGVAGPAGGSVSAGVVALVDADSLAGFDRKALGLAIGACPCYFSAPRCLQGYREVD